MLKDITGQTFGRLTVVRLSCQRSPQGKAKWHCKCVCGNSAIVVSSQLRSGKTSSCGCLQRENRSLIGLRINRYGNTYRRINILGKRFGRLRVLRFDRIKRGRALWLCQCDCGKIRSLNSCSWGKTRSCGCFRDEQRRVRNERRRKDISGKQFGDLKAIRSTVGRVGRGAYSTVLWHCKCLCGKSHTATTGALLSGNTTSCGCFRNAKLRQPKTTAFKTGVRTTMQMIFHNRRLEKAGAPEVTLHL